VRIPWACPKCGAEANKHGKGGDDKCVDRHGSTACMGFLCECDDEGTPEHGESFNNVCPEAVCYHCRWSGEFPVRPKGLEAWEKKALDAGWAMPRSRMEELKLKEKKA
jgi:hypothetical protein